MEPQAIQQTNYAHAGLYITSSDMARVHLFYHPDKFKQKAIDLQKLW